MTQLDRVIGNYDIFLDDILSRIKGEGFDMNDLLQIDHIAYRSPSIENYALKKQELEQLANLLGEPTVNGRPIAIFRLQKPIIHGNWRIDTIELIAPRPNNSHPEGLEHVEFVIYDDLKTFMDKYSGKSFDTTSINRGINPEISFGLGEYSVRFHLLNLPTVIYLQNKLGISEIKD